MALAWRLSLPPPRISHPHPSLPKLGEHRRGIHTHPLTDPRQRPALSVELHRLVDLGRGQAGSSYQHAVPVQDPTHRPPVNPELVDSRAGLVTGDELLDLLALKLPG